jgi:hypothetical protein
MADANYGILCDKLFFLYLAVFVCRNHTEDTHSYGVPSPILQGVHRQVHATWVILCFTCRIVYLNLEAYFDN